MSDVDFPTTRDAIADSVTADLEAMGQAQAPPDTPPSAPAPVAVPDPQTPVAPAAAAVAEVPPEPLALTDKSVVVDPATGEQKTWGEIKAERLRWADYTKKTMAAADERRQVESMKAQFQAEQNAAQASQNLANLPELPEDDPYAQRIRAIEAHQQAQYEAQNAQYQQLESERLAAASARLDADISRVASEKKLDEREMDYVGREMYARIQRGESVTLDDVATQFVGYREQQRTLAVKEWQEKHRVGSPAASVAVPAAGTPTEMPVPGTRGFVDSMLAELGMAR